MDTLELRFKNINTETPKSTPLISKFLKKKKKYFKDKYFIETELNKTSSTSRDLKLKELNDIWLPTAKITIDEFLLIGVNNKIWDQNRNIITKRGEIYGTGKILLGSLSISLKNFTISETTDYKVVGKAFCEAFNIEINQAVNEKYKAFSSGDTDIIKHFKRLFRVHL